MKVFDSADIRNVGWIGHGDSGKTTLTSTLLHCTGAVNRLGSVDEGNTVTDFDEEEIDRKLSVQAAAAHLEWKGAKVNLLDTPGYAAFLAESKAGLAVADAALMLVDGVGGVAPPQSTGSRSTSAIGSAAACGLATLVMPLMDLRLPSCKRLHGHSRRVRWALTKMPADAATTVTRC